MMAGLGPLLRLVPFRGPGSDGEEHSDPKDVWNLGGFAHAARPWGADGQAQSARGASRRTDVGDVWWGGG